MDINIDDELHLLKGSSFFVDGIEIKPFTIGQIVEIGYEKYQQLLNIFITEVDDILKEIPEELNDITIFDLFLRSGSQELFEGFITAISLFLRIENKNDFGIDNEFNNVVIGEGKIINKYNWSKICKVIQMQNCVKRQKEEEYNPANEEARKIIEKIKALKRENPIKESITLSSMISGVSWKSNNLNILNIWDLTMYQLYDALNRLKLIDDYQFTLTGIYSGTVDNKKINMNDINWMKTFKD